MLESMKDFARDNFRLTIDDVKELIKDRPYKMIEDTFSAITNGFEIETDDGYRAIATYSNITKNEMPAIFHKCNPYTIDNIKKYVANNQIPVELLSTEYLNNSSPLEWRCQCGEIFYASWNAFVNDNKHSCTKCGRARAAKSHIIDRAEIKEELAKGGYEILDFDENASLSDVKIDAMDKDGYLFKISWYSFKKGYKPFKFGGNNSFTIYNINRYFEVNGLSEYECISDIKDYHGANSLLDILHKPCGTIFKSSWADLQNMSKKGNTNRYIKECPICYPRHTESNHASVLKQIFEHEYPDTVLEDKSCVNPENGHILPTDIVNHRLKLAIEVQSHWHDYPDRQKKDAIKKQYWINKGYDFYDPDIRDYTILQMINLFFPDMKQIPEYIDYNFSKCIDFTEIQQYIDEGFTIKEVSEITGAKITTINGMIHNKKVILPNGYSDKAHGIRAIVRLDLDGKYVESFPSMSSAEKYGYNHGNIRKVLNGEQKIHKDSYWLYEDDYLSGNYELPEIKKKENIIIKS